MRHFLRICVVLAMVPGAGVAWAQNTFTVESKEVPTSATRVTVGAAPVDLSEPQCTEICGTVYSSEIPGFGLEGACVQAWTSWPVGVNMDTDTTDINGVFCLDGLVDGIWDIRVYVDGYCTQIIGEVPCGPVDFIVTLDPIPFTEIPAWPFFADYWSTNATVFGVPLLPGDVIVAMDPDGVLCGATTVGTPGEYLIHVLGDEPGTPEDEGAVSGDRITLLLNCVCPALADGLWQDQGSFIQTYDFPCAVQPPVCNAAPVDVNCDGVVNVFDLVLVAQTAYRGAPSPDPCCLEP